MAKIDNYRPLSGRLMREDGTYINVADFFEVGADGGLKVKATVSAEVTDSKIKGSTDGGLTPEGWIPVAVDENGNLKVQLNGSTPVIYGKTLDDRPAASTQPVGTFFILANADLDTWVGNGISWEAVV